MKKHSDEVRMVLDGVVHRTWSSSKRQRALGPQTLYVPCQEQMHDVQVVAPTTPCTCLLCILIG